MLTLPQNAIGLLLVCYYRSDVTHVATVEVKAAGLNFADVFACLGLYSATPKGEFTPGLEFSGVIRHITARPSDPANDEVYEKDEDIPEDCGLSIGDRVMGVTRFGGYASALHIDVRYLVVMPSHLSYAEGAAVPCQALTAWYGLVTLGALSLPSASKRECKPYNAHTTHENTSSSSSSSSSSASSSSSSSSPSSSSCKRKLGDIRPLPLLRKKSKRARNIEEATVLLVHSAAGGVGQWALKICFEINRRVGLYGGKKTICFGTVGSEEKKEFLVEQGYIAADQIIVRKAAPKDFAAQLDDALAVGSRACGRTVEGFSIVFDAIAGSFFAPAYKRLARGGRYIIYGGANYMSNCGDKPHWFSLGFNFFRTRPCVYPLDMVSDNKSMMGFNLIWLWDKVEMMNDLMMDFASIEWDPPHIGKTFRFEEADAAVRYLQKGINIGKVCIIVDDEENVHSGEQQ